MKRIISLLLALVMLISLCVPAFAVSKLKTDSETGEFYEEFTFNFGVPYGYNTTVEGEKFNIEVNMYYEWEIVGGKNGYAIKIYAKEGNDIVIARVEAKVSSFVNSYGGVGVKPGEKREENIGSNKIAHIDNIDSKEFVFDGGTNFVAFSLVRVYYECAGEHTWGENGICRACGLSNCFVTGEHIWNRNGICRACGARKCDVTGEHTWNENGICGACGARKCDVTGEHTWNENGICRACGALKCGVTGEHTWNENGICRACGALKCDVTGEHTWNENGICRACGLSNCFVTGEHTWNKNGICRVCNELKCDVTDEHTWDENSVKCKYCGVLKCEFTNEHNAISICAYCGEELSEGGTASTVSEGNIPIIVGIACAAVFGLGGYLLGKKKKK